MTTRPKEDDVPAADTGSGSEVEPLEPAHRPVSVFLSYAHEDAPLRAFIETHLAAGASR